MGSDGVKSDAQQATFNFEADFVGSLRCIPMQVRLKLDTCGIKLKLSQWNQFSLEQRQFLVEQPCETTAEVQRYRQLLRDLVREKAGVEATDLPVVDRPAWQDTAVVPASVNEQAQKLGIAIALAQWSALSPLQRFALIKLSQSEHEHSNFLPALKEFCLVRAF